MDRFRLANAKGGYLMPQLDFGNAKIVRANDHVFLQGQTGMTLDGKDFVGEGDPAAQAEKAMRNVRELLEEADAKMEDICKLTTYVTEPSRPRERVPRPRRAPDGRRAGLDGRGRQGAGTAGAELRDRRLRDDTGGTETWATSVFGHRRPTICRAWTTP